ncbi:hypothetical protein PPYR_10500 [Photinus pyralis]|uniref:GH16 domain-containing protein n=2 Tax=Photinus pyralis TaxID=7054 RepID=A0A1Y1MK51_PHOPY|nr:beta-1,3-glucan-binding protein-like [Photinus pyralis]KAB0796439.1 hypothetical protein PPYR_10500 [Photinus pyralis]
MTEMSFALRVLSFVFIVTLGGRHVLAKESDINGTTKAPPANRNLCMEGQTTVNGKRSCKGKIVFQELFSGLSNKWRPEIKFAGDPDYEFVLYKANSTNLYVKDNALHIRPTLLEDTYGEGFVTESNGLDLGIVCTGLYGTLQCVQRPRAWIVLPPVVSAQISTTDYFSFKYGIVEIRARLPAGDWIYPEISLISRSELYGPGYESGRIRIAVTGGSSDQNRHLFGGCTFGYSEMARRFGYKRIASKNPWSDDFHTFKIQWKPDSISFGVDNQIYGTVTPPSGGFATLQNILQIDPMVAERWEGGTVLAPFDQEMFITLGVGVGGQMYPDLPEVNKPWNTDDPKAQLQFYRNKEKWYNTWGDKSELVVDYIKVFAI